MSNKTWKAKQFYIEISPTMRLSVIEGWGGQYAPEVGLIIKGWRADQPNAWACADVKRFGLITELFSIVERLKATNYDDFPAYAENIEQVEDQTRRVYSAGTAD